MPFPALGEGKELGDHKFAAGWQSSTVDDAPTDRELFCPRWLACQEDRILPRPLPRSRRSWPFLIDLDHQNHWHRDIYHLMLLVSWFSSCSSAVDKNSKRADRASNLQRDYVQRPPTPIIIIGR